MKWNSLTIIFHVVNGCEDHLRFFFAWRLFFKKWLLSDRGHFAVNNDALWPISGVVYRGRKYFTPWIVTLWSISVDRPNNSLFFFFGREVSGFRFSCFVSDALRLESIENESLATSNIRFFQAVFRNHRFFIR